MSAHTSRLKAIRTGLGVTQAEMAALLEVSLRAYSDNELGTARRIYVMAAEAVAMREASRRGEPDLLPEDLREEFLWLDRNGFFGSHGRSGEPAAAGTAPGADAR